jgi:hypothetical protein
LIKECPAFGAYNIRDLVCERSVVGQIRPVLEKSSIAIASVAMGANGHHAALAAAKAPKVPATFCRPMRDFTWTVLSATADTEAPACPSFVVRFETFKL